MVARWAVTTAWGLALACFLLVDLLTVGQFACLLGGYAAGTATMALGEVLYSTFQQKERERCSGK